MRPRWIALAAALALALCPAGALAQSAGDEQYFDPLDPSRQPPQAQPQSEQPAPEQGAPAPVTETQEALPTPAAEPPVETAEATAAQTLPRTGFPVLLPVAAGWWLLLGGLALRRVA